MRKSWLLALPLLAVRCAIALNRAVYREMNSELAACPLPPAVTYVEGAKCGNRAIMRAAGETRPPDLITAEQITATIMRVAEKLDAGEITKGQGQQEVAAMLAALRAQQVQENQTQQQINIQRQAVIQQGFQAPVIWWRGGWW